jgi:hypothetical protein
MRMLARVPEQGPCHGGAGISSAPAAAAHLDNAHVGVICCAASGTGL